MRNLTVGLAALVILGNSAPLSAAVISLTDQTFSDSVWTTIGLEGYLGQTVSQQPDGGGSGTSPDPFRKVTTITDAEFTTAHLNPNLVLDPSLTPILSIDFAIDYKNIAIFGQGQAIRALVKQGTTYYGAAYKVTGDGSSVWTTYNPNPLTADSFTEFPFSSSAEHPDFSASGAPITFGFGTSNDRGNGITVGYDDFSMTIVTGLSAVPEPSSLIVWSLLGLAGVTVILRRRKPA